MVAFRLPSKSGLFQPDLYPPFPSNKPASNFEEWMTGVNKPALTMELRPEKSTGAAKKGGLNNLKNMMSRGSNASMEEVKGEPAKSVEELQAEIK